MKTGLTFLASLGLMAAAVVALDARQSGVFFTEGWDAGGVGQTFNSRYYGSTAGSQFSLETGVRASGSGALRHTMPAGTPASQLQFATQHIGDAINGPVYAGGAGQHFYDLYVQFKVYYSPGFDLTQGLPKQLIIGTEDERRHDNVCCNPWVSHYLTIVPPHTGRGTFVAEANNKQAASGQWVGMGQNRSGYTAGNLFVTQTGRWYTVEVRRRLNDPGADNGIFQLWTDGVLISEYTNIRYRVPWNGTFGANMTYGTNFVMISDYMAIGSSQNQSVYYDDFKFSTTYIGASGGPLPQTPRNLRIVLPPSGLGAALFVAPSSLTGGVRHTRQPA